MYLGPAKRHTFQALTFAEELQSAVENKKPLHLVPKDPNFPALDSAIYDPGPEGGIHNRREKKRVDREAM